MPTPYDLLNDQVQTLGAWSAGNTPPPVTAATPTPTSTSGGSSASSSSSPSSSGSSSGSSGGGGGVPWQWNPTSGPIDRKFLTTIHTKAGNVTVSKEASGSFKGFLDELASRGYKVKSLGGYNPRKMRSDGNVWSSHAGGYAIDINPVNNPVTRNGKVITNLPPWVNSLAAKYNLRWGGAWKGPTYDPMHFSYKVAR